ncbi:MAG: hypothetical protein ACKOW9_02310 [Candidatus Paceibacterota bacterium]
MLKFIQIFLLFLIIIGLGLLATQKMWVPRVVDMILVSEGVSPNSPEIESPVLNTPTTDSAEVSMPKGE